MVQWARTSVRSRAGDAWAGGRLVTPWTISVRVTPVARTVVVRRRLKTCPTWGKARYPFSAGLAESARVSSRP
jgi:hypothetical protein